MRGKSGLEQVIFLLSGQIQIYRKEEGGSSVGGPHMMNQQNKPG